MLTRLARGRRSRVVQHLVWPPHVLITPSGLRRAERRPHLILIDRGGVL
jgi:hypothetical protein